MLGVGLGEEDNRNLGTSKEHPRNMLATCLLLRHYYGEATALRRRCGYISGGGTSAWVRLSASLRSLMTWRVQMKTCVPGGGLPNFLT